MSILVPDMPGKLYNADRMAYELKPYNVKCKDCKRTDSGSQMELEQRQWSLTWRGEICGSCESINRQFQEVFV